MPGNDSNGDALNGLIESLSSQLICEPMQLEDKIIIPICKLDMGFGTRIDGTGANLDGQCAEEGSARHAACGGAKVSPVAVLIIFREISGPNGMKVALLSPPGESLSSIAHDLMENMMSQ